jgi:hypothetical protein
MSVGMHSFNDLIPDNTELSSALIKSSGMKSVILPELPSSEEIEKIAALFAESQFDAYQYEYGQTQQHRLCENVNELSIRPVRSTTSPALSHPSRLC